MATIFAHPVGAGCEAAEGIYRLVRTLGIMMDRFRGNGKQAFFDLMGCFWRKRRAPRPLHA